MVTLGPSTSRMGQMSFTEHADSGSKSDIDVLDLINHSDKISSTILILVCGAGSNDASSRVIHTALKKI